MSDLNQVPISISPPPQEKLTNNKSPEIRLILVCQAEGLQSRYSELNTDESGLTALGWEQTNSLARWIAAHEKIDILLSAPHLRSRLTAQRLGQVLGKAIVIVPELPSHIRSGIEHNTEQHPLFTPLHIHEQFDSTAKFTALREKLVVALQKIVHDYWGKTVCIVLDGNSVLTALTIFCNSSNLAFSMNHTALAEIAWHAGEWCIVYTNRMEHRPAPALPTNETTTAATDDTHLENNDEDLSQVLSVYNRVLNVDTDLVDLTDDQRLHHLLEFAALPTGLRVMDVGTGTGRLALLMADEYDHEVVGIDISPAMLEVAEYLRLSSISPAKNQVMFRLAAAQRVPIRSESFDAIVCRLVLHHSQHPERLLQELVRLLKPEGLLILADLLGPDDPVKRATQNTIESRRNPSHVNAYSVEQYRKFIDNVGLTLVDESVAVFEQDLEEWLAHFQSNPASRSVVREMMEAGLETDAAGLKVRKQNKKLVFDQRLIYIKAEKPAT